MPETNPPRDLVELDTAACIAALAETRAVQPAFDEIRARARTHTRRTGLAVAAAVAAVVVSGVALGQQVTDSARPAPAAPSPSDPPGTVAWAPLPPTDPTIATHTSAERPDPALAAQAPACRSQDLAAEGSLDGAGGQWILTTTFRNVSATPCHLDGAPTWSFEVNGSQTQVPQHTAGGTDSYEKAVLLDARHDATAVATWSTQDCATSAGAMAYVAAPGTSAALPVADVKASPVCTGDGAGAFADLRVATVAPEGGWTRAHTESDWAGVRAELEPPVDVTAGGTAAYVLTLTSPRAVDLGVCPDYVVDLTSMDASGTDRARYSLNCADVPHTGPSGHPELPADTPVSFAMRLEVPKSFPPAKAKLGWRLSVPEHVAAAAVVQVG